MKFRHNPLAGLFILSVLLSCTSAAEPAPEVPPPLPLPSPLLSLSFEGIRAEGIDALSLDFVLYAENNVDSPCTLSINGQNLLINGVGADAFSLIEAACADAILPGGSGEAYPVTVSVDLSKFPLAGAEDFDEYLAELQLDMLFSFDSGEGVGRSAFAEARFPRIREPVFNITSIAVRKAELINTRFRVSLRIDNPNHFPVELASFSYELYGAGRFWADGKESDVLHIPAKGSAETDLHLVMNFINMRRELLDQVIAMRQVAYRFSGQAVVDTGIPYLPRFVMNFNRSGYSDVIE